MKREFFKYIKALFLVSLPIIIQQLFVNIASLLDTLMVGQLDDSSVSGVYIATQIIFVVNLAIFGATEGGSVFLCQFKGLKDKDKITNSFSFKLMFSVILATMATIIILLFNRQLASLFTNNQEAIEIACNYMKILSISFIPFAITNAISTSMRELDHPVTPMTITAIGIVFNFMINYVLIFGKFGFPRIGATGAAIGTIFERLFEFIACIILCFIKKYDFLFNLKENIKINKELLKKMIIKSVPLLINETLWAIGQSVLVYFFSRVDEIATVVLPISNTIYNLIFVVCLGIGNGISILIGEVIGSGEYAQGQKKGYFSLIFTLIIGITLGTILFIIAPWVVTLYTGVNVEAQRLAMYLIRFNAFYILICALNNALFFLMRSGGRTEIVLLFDSFYAFLIQIPGCIILLHFFKLDLVTFICIIYSLDIIKLIIGAGIVISKKWIKNLTLSESK